MVVDGWEGADTWRKKANKIAPTLVGGSKKHGGHDLGSTRARQAWQKLHVNGNIVGNNPPEKGYQGYKDKE
jgi:DNA (cytosine-5)-methyltransferase 1